MVTRIPSDSADVAELREAQQSQREASAPAPDRAQAQHHEASAQQATTAPHRCHDGWVGEDADGRPRPCPQCRPWLCVCPGCGSGRTSCESKALMSGRRCCENCPHLGRGRRE
jgi:hypothetical protein